jgi:hypothetical protein
MKYSEILDDVISGKWVRANKDSPWIYMDNEKGLWFEDGNTSACIVPRKSYSLNTWEVKEEDPKEKPDHILIDPKEWFPKTMKDAEEFLRSITHEMDDKSRNAFIFGWQSALRWQKDKKVNIKSK